MSKRGRPIGIVEISYKDLGDFVGNKTKIPILKKWLEPILGEELDNFCVDINAKKCQNNDSNLERESEIESKIEYTLTNFNNE